VAVIGGLFPGVAFPFHFDYLRFTAYGRAVSLMASSAAIPAASLPVAVRRAAERGYDELSSAHKSS